MVLEAYDVQTYAEKALLGSILFLPDILPQVKSQLSYTDFQDAKFYDSKHARIYKAMLAFDGEILNQITLANAMSRQGTLKPGDYEYFMELLNSVPTPYDWQSYLDVIKPQSPRPKFTGAI